MAGTTASRQALQLKDILSPKVFRRVDDEARRTGKSHERVIDEALLLFTERNGAGKKLSCNKCRTIRLHEFAGNRDVPGTHEKEQLYRSTECGHTRRYGVGLALTL